MQDKRKFRLFFEQSNTFRDVLREKGFEAYSYDIEGSPDYKVDLFEVIDNRTIDIKPNETVIAFFPCTYFSQGAMLGLSCNNYGYRNFDDLKKLRIAKANHKKRCEYYDHLCNLFIWSLEVGFKLIVENPLTGNYLKANFPIQPAIEIIDRSSLGDCYKKPTMFYFVNCTPNLAFGFEFECYGGVVYKIDKSSGMLKRSLISQEFARQFLEAYVL